MKEGDKVRLVSASDVITSSAVGDYGCKIGDVGKLIGYDAPHWVVDMRESQPTYHDATWWLHQDDLEIVEAAS